MMASPKHAQHAHGATRALSTDLGRGNSGIIKGRCAERPIISRRKREIDGEMEHLAGCPPQSP